MISLIICHTNVLCHLSKHLGVNNLEVTFQSACKVYHSTETALVKVTSDTLNYLDKNKVCHLTLRDLSTDIDTIDHEILVRRLEKTSGLSGTVLKWFESYLCSRSQSVKIVNSNSEFMSI